MGLHNVSDFFIFFAYFVIPIALIRFVRERKDLPFRGTLVLFGAFIYSCGTTHLIDIILFHVPVYVLSGWVKAFTAVVSVGTIFALGPTLRHARTLKGPAEINQILDENNRSHLQREVMFRQLAQVMPQIVWAADEDGHTYYYNDRYYEYTGSARTQNEWCQFVHPDDLPGAEARWKECVRTGTPYEMEFRFRRHDGVYRWHISRAAPVVENGVVVRWFGSTTDIHDLKEMAVHLQEADRNKDEFLAMLGHELRNPLAPIVNATQILKSAATSAQDAKMVVEMIERQTTVLARMMDDLLDVSRIGNGHLVMKARPVDLREAVTRAVETMQSQVDADHHTLSLDLPTRPVPSLGDLHRLTQVVSNLIANAVKYTEKDGAICVRLRAAGREAEIVVADNGVGIDPAVLPQVCAPFVQAPQGISRSRGGLGIGLTLVQRLVEMHGGRVTVTSPGVGMGTTVTVNLPLTGEPIREETSSTEHPALRLRKILVVDDNRDNARSLGLLLQAEGHEVELAFDGGQATDLFDRIPFDVVFLDIGLPVKDGYEVARHIRQAGRQVELVAMTGYGQPQDREKSLSAGFDHHLVKPVNLKTITRLLNAL